MVLHFIRAVFLLTVLALTFSAATGTDMRSLGEGWKLTLFMVAPLVMGMVVVTIDLFWQRKNLRQISGLFFGLLAGLAIAFVLGSVVDLVAGIFPGSSGVGTVRAVNLIKALVGATSVFLCVSFVMQTRDDFRFIIPYVEFAKQTKGARPILLDTSVIIDGRVCDMAETGVLENQLLVPRFVLTELHAVADSADKLRRNRGRRGLDVLKRMQSSDKIDLTVLDLRSERDVEGAGVDNKLVALARKLGGRVMTNDYSLNKVAQLAGVDVVNINDLANALKTILLPGERIQVKLIKPGEESAQGVGYLDDGTMVVVEQGREHVGRQVGIVVTSVLQTSAGRLVFGRLEESTEPSAPGRK